jgi:hypothetical protein
MNKKDLYPLIGKYLNGYKIVKIEEDPFVKGQINLWTDEWITKYFGDKSIVKFFVRPESNSSKIYKESALKEIENLQQENKQLKSILTKLEEWLKETRINSAFIDEQTIMEVQLKIQELEQGSDSND